MPSRIAIAIAVLILAAPWPAAAQFGGLGRASAPRSAGPAARPPPAALPGLERRSTIEPIPADPNISLPPNAALFDAINRGDLPAARDSIARGADIDARNVLGLTPIDAAVDQGRNEIMFYLLSVRGAARRQPEPEFAAAPPPSRVPAARRPAAPAAAAAREAAPPAPSGPRLWAGDGGAPIPLIGFLGFDAGRPAGAGPLGAEPARSGGRPRMGRG